jgi:hypothetical protein
LSPLTHRLTIRAAFLTSAEQDLYRALGANAFGSAVRLEQERVSFTALEAALSRVADKALDCQYQRYADPA